MCVLVRGKGDKEKEKEYNYAYYRSIFDVQCYAVDGATKNRQNVGYVMLDLRTAHPKSQQVCMQLL